MADLGVLDTFIYSDVSVIYGVIPKVTSKYKFVLDKSSLLVLDTPLISSGFRTRAFPKTFSVHIYDFPEIQVGIIRTQRSRTLVPVWEFFTATPQAPFTMGSINRLDTTGHIEGTLKEEGVVKAGVLVDMYWRETRALAQSTFSDSEGKFRFNGLRVGKPLYFILALNSPFNASIYDAVKPVNEDNIIPPDYVYVPPVMPESDGIVWHPSSEATMLVLDGMNFTRVVSDGNGISKMKDMSGNKRHAEQVTSTKRPTYVNNSYIEFDENDEELVITSPYLGTQTIFLCLNPGLDSEYVTFWSGNDTYYGMCAAATANQISTSPASYILDGVDTTWTNRSHVLAALSNRVSVVEIRNTDLSSWPGFRIGYSSNPFPTWSLFGKIYDVVVVSGTPSTELRDKIVGWMAWRRGVAANLPIGHPYKNKKIYSGYSKYPIAFTDTYIKRSSEYSSQYSALDVCNNLSSLTGASEEASWICGGGLPPHKLSVDMGSSVIPVGVYIENYHHYGSYTDRGVDSLLVYGTNSRSAFSNINADDVTELELLASLSVLQHTAVDEEHPQWFYYQNENAYLYVVYRVVSNHGGALSAIRRLETLVRN